jgi:hypothetical protein
MSDDLIQVQRGTKASYKLSDIPALVLELGPRSARRPEEPLKSLRKIGQATTTCIEKLINRAAARKRVEKVRIIFFC